MYNYQLEGLVIFMFWQRYELLCTQKEKSPNALAKEIGAGTSACTYWKKGTIPKGETLLKIADTFDCSVDYLLGRTDNPQAHKNTSSVSVGDVSGNSGAIGIGNTVTNSTAPLDEYQTRLLELFDELTIDERTELLGDLKFQLKKKAVQKDDNSEDEENSKDNSFWSHVSEPIFCPEIHVKAPVLIQIDKKDDDTIIGYDCDYPHCPSSMCKLPKLYPIGTSDREARKKLK